MQRAVSPAKTQTGAGTKAVRRGSSRTRLSRGKYTEVSSASEESASDEDVELEEEEERKVKPRHSLTQSQSHLRVQSQYRSQTQTQRLSQRSSRMGRYSTQSTISDITMDDYVGVEDDDSYGQQIAYDIGSSAPPMGRGVEREGMPPPYESAASRGSVRRTTRVSALSSSLPPPKGRPAAVSGAVAVLPSTGAMERNGSREG